MPWYQTWLVRGAAVVLALLLCSAIMMLVTGLNPIEVYATMGKGVFGTQRKAWLAFQKIAVLLGIALAVTPAFKMRFWNIGAEGQVMIGGLAAAAVMIEVSKYVKNNVILILLMVIASVVAGGIWGFLPAF